jgi:hypothetical protein
MTTVNTAAQKTITMHNSPHTSNTVNHNYQTQQPIDTKHSRPHLKHQTQPPTPQPLNTTAHTHQTPNTTAQPTNTKNNRPQKLNTTPQTANTNATARKSQTQRFTRQTLRPPSPLPPNTTAHTHHTQPPTLQHQTQPPTNTKRNHPQPKNTTACRAMRCRAPCHPVPHATCLVSSSRSHSARTHICM